MKTLHSITCCQAVPENAAHDVPPTMIEHMLITEYCDGATSGFLQCSACSSVYRFVTVDWSRSQSIRVIALSLVPVDSMRRLQSFFAEIAPQGQWIPKLLQRASDQDLDRIESFLFDITKDAKPPSIVIAWDVSTNTILSARHVDGLSPDHFANMLDFGLETDRKRYDWFADLGIQRDR